MKKIPINRKGEVWEWVTSPTERYYIVRSWEGIHPADGMPTTFHEMLNLNTGVLVEEYLEDVEFEKLACGGKPEMTRLL